MYSIQIVLLFLDNTWATAQSTSNLMPLLDYLIQLKTCGCLCVPYYLRKTERNNKDLLTECEVCISIF